MPAIKKGYSEKHNQHPNWLYVPAFDCHVRVSLVMLAGGSNSIGCILSKEENPLFEREKMEWKGWLLDTYSRYNKGEMLFSKGVAPMTSKMVDKRINSKRLNIQPFEPFYLPHGNLYHYLKENHVNFVVHYYNKKVAGIALPKELRPSVLDGKQYCYKNGDCYKILGKNLFDLKTIFEKLGWDIEMRFHWMKLAMSDNSENVALSNNMLQAYFNETNN